MTTSTRRERWLWLAFADDVLGLAAGTELTLTRLALCASTVVGIGLTARRRPLVVAHLAVTWVTLALVLHGAPGAAWDRAVAALVIGVVLPLGVAVMARHWSTRSRELTAEADLDPLTLLANRRGLESWVQSVAPAEVTVLVLDLDGLKELNDRDGHAQGDRALVAVARALVRELRDGQQAARLGGDEFAFVAVHHRQVPDAMASRVHAAAHAAALAHGASASTGAATGRLVTGADLGEVLRVADHRLLAAKSRGGGALVATG